MKPGPPMEPKRWRRIAAVLDLVLDRPPEERSAFLDEACAGDADLRAEVEAFLAADAEAGAFLDTPAGEYAPELLAEAAGEEESGEADLAGHHVGRYRLLREIGGGGMGTVYEAEDTQLGRRVAVKILPPEYSRDRRAKERFLREARAAAAVDHPNLCTVHDAGESEGRLYIVLSYYEGETLRDRIRRGPLPIAEAREIAIQVARGLARAHEAGIVHRDIKPANVMLPRRGEAKILDFGIARLQGDEVSLTRTGASWGTPAYMSPEQARGEPVDARADVWSLGVMLYEMIAGRRPFGGESIEALVSSILTQEPAPLERLRPDVPPELARVAELALVKDPGERYASAAEILADLETMKVPRRRFSRKKVLRVTLLAAAVLVLLALALWRPWQEASGPPMPSVLPAPLPPSPSMQVAVLQPVVKTIGKNPEADFIAADVQRAVLAALVSLEGVQPLDPPERNEEKAVEEARLREADEALLSTLSCQEGTCQVTFLRRKDRRTLKVSDSLEVQGGFENAHALAEGVRVRIQQIYPNYKLSSGGDVRREDYSTYIALERRAESGESLGEAELDQLDALLRTSSGLIGAYALATTTARRQGDFDRALDYANRAEKIAPYDPRPLMARLLAEVEGDRLDAAPATLARLESLAPGDIRVKATKADLLRASGKLKAALSLREEIARRRPTWQNIVRLGMLEFRLGKCKSARLRLENLLAERPHNQRIQEYLAAFGTACGDLQQTASLYEELIRSGQAPYLTTNLGFVRFLLGDYEAAEEAYRKALAGDPDDPMARFNLATALEAQGDLAGARRLYRDIEKELAAAPAARFTAHTRMLHAQCLARLGKKPDAERILDEVLKNPPEDIQLLHQAAQVYALLGDPVALVYVDLALKKGVQRAWFEIPEFRSLAKDPIFQRLLDRSTGS